MSQPRQYPPPPVPVYGNYSPQNDTMARLIPYKNAPALVGYYLGVFSAIPFLGVALGIAAIILGIVGLQKVARNPELRGKAHAIVAIVCGAVFGLGWLALGIFLMMH